MGSSLRSSRDNVQDHPIQQIDLIRDLNSDDRAVRNAALGQFAAILSGSQAVPELLGDEIVQPMWQRIVEMAEEHNQPGTFSTFIGWEWGSIPVGANLPHRLHPGRR